MAQSEPEQQPLSDDGLTFGIEIIASVGDSFDAGHIKDLRTLADATRTTPDSCGSIRDVIRTGGGTRGSKPLRVLGEDTEDGIVEWTERPSDESGYRSGIQGVVSRIRGMDDSVAAEPQ